MKPCKYPKIMETGKKMRSLGCLRNKPINFTILVKANIQTS